MELKRIGEFCRLRQGFQVPLSEQETEQKGGYVRFIRIVDYTQETTDIRYIKDSDRFYYVKEDDVVMVRYGAAGEVGHGITGVIANNMFLIDPLIDINKDYLYYFLAQNRIKNKLLASSASTTMPALNFKIVNDLEVPIYDKHKQDNIVSILNKLSSIICKRQKEIIVLDELIKARFVEMFGDINSNDKNWDSQPLGELCTIVRGGSPRPIEKFIGGDVPWIKIGDATDGESIYLNSTKEHIIQEGVKKSRLVKAGSLIFANCGVSLGFARIITFDGCIHDGWLAMEDIDERLDKVFLLQALNQMTEHFRAIAPAGTQPNLNTAIMKAYKQIIPPMELQKNYISFCKQVDKSKVVIQKSLDETQLLFDSLMQKYFG